MVLAFTPERDFGRPVMVIYNHFRVPLAAELTQKSAG